MSNDKNTSPRLFPGVMVSSTFKDLEKHRTALMDALRKEELFAIGMEDYVASPEEDVISSSLNMVRKGSAYIGLVSHRCGQVIECAKRNPLNYSVTRLEFEEAQHLGLPTLIFVMGEDHDVKPRDVETDPDKIGKLNEFRDAAKAGRIYILFKSLADFTSQAIHAVAKLRHYIEEERSRTIEAGKKQAAIPNPIPTPPAFCAEPPYIGSHKFIGREAQLDVLNDWAGAADPHPVLLFDAIGGSGKSMLTWEWTTKHAHQTRKDWAGRFWYSFYEKGGVMSDFCQRALAYMTGKPLEDFRKKKTPELAELLLHHLQIKPWLLVLDGLERVLVHYHRIDAAELSEEAANQPTDQIAQRDPCSAIRPEDDDLLRALAAAAPSKLLFTTRLVPRVLLNQASQPIPGVLRVSLPGLRPADAEALIRSCGVTGDSQAIQDFLKRHCDCHPLVTGILAGLINNYLPSRGSFDAWVGDAAGGGQINLANLNLVQKRNHILEAALHALPEKCRELLSTLALVSESVDYPMLNAFNPYLPPEPKEIPAPQNPESAPWWKEMPDGKRKKVQEWYRSAIKHRKLYETAIEVWRQSPEFHAAPQALAKTIEDLERRGLLQFDRQSQRYDLHPVVRGIAVGRLKSAETNRYGERVVDYFSRQAHRPYAHAETLEDLKPGLYVVRTLLKMGRLQDAYWAYSGDLAQALKFNVEADAECMSLMRPFFPKGWSVPPKGFGARERSYLANEAAIALRGTGQRREALQAFGVALLTDLRQKDWQNVRTDLCNITYVVNSTAKNERFLGFALDIAELTNDATGLFVTRLDRFSQLDELGQLEKAEAMWRILDPMGREWSRNNYRPGSAESAYARFNFRRGRLKEGDLARAERLAKEGKNRGAARDLHSLRGEWRLEQRKWSLAAESLREAVRMAREVGQTNARAETQLAIAKFYLKQLPNPDQVATQLAQARSVSHRALAELWTAVGDPKQAEKHALAAYEAAWEDGEPYVFRHGLNKATALLKQLGVKIPKLLPYDLSKDQKLPWEDEVGDAIEKLRLERRPKMTKPRGKIRARKGGGA
ncbi:MAG: DUF4062 domain-containing protein [Verrucomicrobia bacterium]|nr:DUF4062 domain-containing protein [Verrucomicrobiota bacterium]